MIDGTMVPATKDCPFCGHWVVSCGGAVGHRGGKCTKNTFCCGQGAVSRSHLKIRSHIGVQNVLKILFGADKGRSHKTSRSLIGGSLVAGTTVYGKEYIGITEHMAQEFFSF